jgi:Tfp pilus assembly protein FimV
MGVVATLTASGCGGSSTKAATGSQTTAATGTAEAAQKVRFVSAAERICTKLATEEKPLKARQEVLKSQEAGPAETTFVSLAQQVVTISRKALASLDKLPRPPKQAAAIATLLSIYADQITDVNDLASAVANRESTSGEGADSALKRALAAGAGLAKTYGIASCTTGGA